MKSVMILLVGLILTFTGPGLADPPDSTLPIAVYLIRDTSPSGKKWSNTVHYLEQQVVASLQPGDFLECISSHSHDDVPRLRLAQFIQTGGTEEQKSILAILDNIGYAVFHDADVGKAFELAWQRRCKITPTRRFARYVVIILTDGNLKDSETEQICQVVQRYRTVRDAVYITGASGTNPDLLTASAQHQLTWQPLAGAQPGLWLDKLRQEALQAKKTSEEKTVTPKPTVEERPEHESQGKSPSPVADPSPRIDPVPAADPKPVIPSPPPSPAQAPDTPAVTIHKTNDSKETIAIAKPPPAPTAPAQPPASISKPSPSRKDGLGKEIRSLLITLAFVAVFAFIVFGVVWGHSLPKARKWSESLTRKLPRRSVRPAKEVLVARWHDQRIRLGNPANIGRGSGNILRIEEESVAQQHLRIYRKRDRLLLRNLARTPVVVNETIVPPGRKHKLILPATVRLSDTVTLELTLVRLGNELLNFEEET